MKRHSLSISTSPFRAAALVAAAFALSFQSIQAQLQPIEEDQGVGGLGLALRKLGVIGSALYVTAHPDDENNAVLAKLSRGQGRRVGLLTLTRGDGGQNEIGPELFQAIGVLRSEELMALHRFDGVEQFFTRAYEFGYSFSVEETFNKWGKEEILGDVVRVIRTFRPQVIITMAPGGQGGGQHHQASARLAAEAFDAAADPQRFPDQISQEGLKPWKALRLFQSTRFRRIDQLQSDNPGLYTIDVGEYDPLLGETYAEFGIRGRNMHRCQGQNQLTRPGPAYALYRLAKSHGAAPEQGSDFFQGIRLGLGSLSQYDVVLSPLLAQLQRQIKAANDAYRSSDFAEAGQAVMRGLEIVRKAKSQSSNHETLHWLNQEEDDFLAAAAKGHFIHFSAFALGTRDGTFVPGESLEAELRYYDRSGRIEKAEFELSAPSGWTVEKTFQEGGIARFRIGIPSQAEYSQPYWYRDDLSVDRYSVRDGYVGMEPFPPPPLTARLRYSSAGVEASMETSVQHRWFDPDSAKDRRMEIKIVPRVSLRVTPEVTVLSTRNPQEKELRVEVLNGLDGESAGTVRLRLPQGWKSQPEEIEFKLTRKNERTSLPFRVFPPQSIESREHRIDAVASVDGRTFTQGYQAISYHHIQTRHLYHPARARIVAFDYEIPADLKVGYVTGVGDDVGSFTEEMGFDLTYLNAEDLAEGDLSAFDTIVLGVRAYLKRQDLISNNSRLLDYARQGGHLVVQWNKYEFVRSRFTPYPMRLGRPADRVSVEEAPVRVLVKDHPAFTFPNLIGPADWDGWVQERATYMWGEWDERFVPLIEMEDPWPYNSGVKRGGLLVAPYGDGTYFFAGLAFFRQLPAGVPGAYRLWANILSMGRRSSEGAPARSQQQP